jgi:hypothetical protein
MILGKKKIASQITGSLHKDMATDIIENIQIGSSDSIQLAYNALAFKNIILPQLLTLKKLISSGTKPVSEIKSKVIQEIQKHIYP